MSFKIQKKDKFTLVKTSVEKLDTTVAPALKSELVILNSDTYIPTLLTLTTGEGQFPYVRRANALNTVHRG